MIREVAARSIKVYFTLSQVFFSGDIQICIFAFALDRLVSIEARWFTSFSLRNVNFRFSFNIDKTVANKTWRMERDVLIVFCQSIKAFKLSIQFWLPIIWRFYWLSLLPSKRDLTTHPRIFGCENLLSSWTSRNMLGRFERSWFILSTITWPVTRCVT